LDPAEEVEETSGMHDGDLTLQRRQTPIVRVDHVSRDKCSIQRVPVTEEIVADVKILLKQVGAKQLGAIDTISAELPNDLAYTTPDVKQGIRGLGERQTEQNLLIPRVILVNEVEEFPSPQARRLGYLPCIVSLTRRQNWSAHRQ
jgi:hypothetical protein